MGNVGDGWSNHRNSKESRGERASQWLSDQISAGGPNRRHAAKGKASRNAAEDMNAAPGGSTRKHGKHGASEQLTGAQRRAADKFLKKGKK